MELKKMRLLTNKTQKEVANDIGLTQFTYSNYEIGKTQPDYETLIKLADYFHTTVDNLLGHQVPYLLDKSALSQEQQELLNYIQNLSPQNCKRVKDFIIGILIAEEEKQNLLQKFRSNNDWRKPNIKKRKLKNLRREYSYDNINRIYKKLTRY